MAAKERILGNLQPQKKRQCQDDDYLDVDLLCRKLEIAKRELEEREAASRARRQVRRTARNDSNASAGSERPQLSNRASTNDSSKRTSWYKLPTKFRQSYSVLSTDIPENEAVEHLDLISPVLDQEDRDCVFLSRGSTPDEDASQQRQHLKAKRSSFTVLKHFTSSDRDQLWRMGNTDKERPTSKQRSQTVPLIKSKFLGSKQNLLATDERKDSCRPSNVDDSLGRFVNEYTVSFDTCEVHENMRYEANGVEQPRPPPSERPKWTQNDGMRSLLNLSSMLKKDKKDRPQTHVAEFRNPIDEDDEADRITRRLHTRSQTAPEELICDTATGMKKQEKMKKRRSVSGLLQTLLLPNHSMSMHQVAI